MPSPWYAHKIPPPVIDAACAALMWQLARSVPAGQLWPPGGGAWVWAAALALAAAGALGWPVKAVWQHRALWPAGVLLPWAFVSAELAEWFGAGREGRSMQEKSAR